MHDSTHFNMINEHKNLRGSEFKFRSSLPLEILSSQCHDPRPYPPYSSATAGPGQAINRGNSSSRFVSCRMLRVIVQAIIHTIKENPRMRIVKPKVKLVTVAHPRLGETNVTVLIDCRTDGAAVANPEDERRRLFDQSLTSIQEQFYNNIIQLRSDCRPTVLQWVLAYQGAQPEPRSLWPITSLYGRAHFAMDRSVALK